MKVTPTHLMYTKTHEWLETDADNVTLGITEHAQQLLGDLVFVELPEIGKEVQAGEELGVVESVKAASDFYAPISGVVIAINHQVVDNPGLVNQDPYGEGWLVKMKVTAAQEIENLLDAAHYLKEVEGEH